MTTAVPRFVANLQGWWDELLGPNLGAAFARVSRLGGDTRGLQDTYGATVAAFETALDEAAQAVLDLQDAARDAGTDWQGVASNAAIAYTRMNDRWVDPAASAPSGTAGPVSSVIQTARRVVTVVGIAWAAASLVHAVALSRWAREQARRARAGEAAPRLRSR